MKRTLAEQKVLDKLNIDSFRQLTKDKVIELSSMLDKVDPEVAKQALEQFPNFASTLKEMLVDYKNTLDLGLKENTESVKMYYDSCNQTIAALQKMLENDNLSFEEKKYAIDKMIEINKMIGDKDSENKKFIAALAVLGTAVLLVGTQVLAGTLGVNIGTKSK